METQALIVDVEVDGSTVELPLRLTRYPGRGKPVLLLHGANTSAEIFTEPNGGLVAYLHEKNPELDIWNLDWRGSPHVMKAIEAKPLFDDLSSERRVFTIERVASEDLNSALEAIARLRADDGLQRRAVSLIGFCVGAGAIAHAVANAQLGVERVDRVVLMTLGMFYKTPWDGWLKTQEYLLEQTVARYPRQRWVSPFVDRSGTEILTAAAKSAGTSAWSWFRGRLRPGFKQPAPQAPSDEELGRWPGTLEDAFKQWKEHLPLGGPPWFSRLSFMYGEPFSQHALGAQSDTAHYERLFGPLHLGLYMDSVTRVRAGRPRLPRDVEPSAARAFAELDVLLIGGAQNRLWHREALDLMYEWLRRTPALATRTHKKLILSDFAHLDLLWGAGAREQVYKPIYEAVC